ncbi:hypothetical protein [Danxiaibacter flavus]|uniref:hypothetical protein n=1 Tax=Danxiaibacter flavus TaxID=3049108 RepID=UPI003F6CFDA7
MADVNLHEDCSRKIAVNAAQNFSVINSIALNLLQNKKSKNIGNKKDLQQDGNTSISADFFLDKNGLHA